MTIDLSTELNFYLELRQALGLSTIHSAPLLRKFVKHMNTQFAGKSIRTEQVVEWACVAKYSESTQHVRLSTARMFLKHLKAIFPETEVPDIHLIAGVRRPQPYIFSKEQLLRVLSVSEHLDCQLSIEPITLKLMFGLMACTGLRPGEARSLKPSQVLLDDPYPRLLISRTKFSKSRWVLLHPTTVEKLRLYSKQMPKSREFFFASKSGATINRVTLHNIFQRIVAKADIEPASGQSRPTLHSFRHWFATNRMRQWYELGEDVRALLPSLAVYLGHVNPADTYWYLTCTPELMASASLRFERFAERRQP